MTEAPNVVAMPGYNVPTGVGEPVARIVEMIEHFLAKARAGEVVAVAWACVLRDGSPLFTCSTAFEKEDGTGYALDSAINRLQRRYSAYMDE